MDGTGAGSGRGWGTRAALAAGSALAALAALWFLGPGASDEAAPPVAFTPTPDLPTATRSPDQVVADSGLPSVLELEHPDYPRSAFVREAWREQPLRSRKPNNRTDPFVHYRYRGHYVRDHDWPEHPRGSWRLSTNSLGMREDHEPFDGRPDLRILIAGDSHTDGVCWNDEGFGNLLEGRLRGERPNQTIESLNAARGGYDPYHYLGTLERFLYLEPDVFVVALYGGNDFEGLLTLYHAYNGSERPPGAQLYGDLIARATEGGGDSPALAQAFLSLKYFDVHPGQMEVALQAARDIATEINVTGLRHGIHPIFVYIPPVTDVAWELHADEFDRLAATLEISDEGLRSTERMADSLLDYLRRLRVDVVDLRPAFRASPEPLFWSTDLHINLRAQRLIAEALHPLVDAARPASMRHARLAPGSTRLEPGALASPGSGFEFRSTAELLEPYVRLPLDPDRPDEHLQGEARLVVVAGDEQISSDPDAASGLAAQLRSRSPGTEGPLRVEVLDSAAPGHTFQHYLEALDRALERRPDVFVLAVNGGNDFLELLRLDAAQHGRPFAPRATYLETLERAAVEHPAAVEQGLAQVKHFTEHPAWGKRAFELALRITTEVRRTCAAHGVELVVAYLPPAATLGPAGAALGLDAEDLAVNERLATPYLDALDQAGFTVVRGREALAARLWTAVQRVR